LVGFIQGPEVGEFQAQIVIGFLVSGHDQFTFAIVGIWGGMIQTIEMVIKIEG
jgi:hypothetical protein